MSDENLGVPTHLDEASGLASALNADTKPTKARRQNSLEFIIPQNCKVQGEF